MTQIDFSSRLWCCHGLLCILCCDIWSKIGKSIDSGYKITWATYKLTPYLDFCCKSSFHCAL